MIEVVPLQIDALDEIDAIERRAYPTPWSRAMFTGELTKPSGRCYGAYEDDRLLAYLIVSRYPDAWHVMNLAVDPDHWRKGIGRTLLERLFADTARDSERGITLEVRVSNAAAIRLYRALGFQPTGIRRGYYTDNREDALIMWRDPPARSRRLMILALESSCDDTCAAVVTRAGEVRASIRSSQADLHARFGGVVPEIASRRHLELVVPVVEAALAEAGIGLGEVDAIAVTQGPGLIGALLVGLSTAKALAYARGLPLVPVDHLLGHVAALRLAPVRLEPPFACLLASGGHTLVLDVTAYGAPTRLGGTRDDAAGEAFDKGARLLGLSEAGGPALERAALGGDPARFPFPAVLRGQDGHDLSFSGLKTALLRRVAELGDGLADVRADLAASFQAAIVRQLAERAEAALDATGHGALAMVGGVAANGALRGALSALCERRGVQLSLLPPALCVDNAAMIAAAAFDAPALEPGDYLALDAYARSPLAG